MFSLTLESLSLIASVFVNFLLAFITLYQIHTDKKLRIDERRTRMQLEAYTRYMQEFSFFDEQCNEQLFAANFQASLVSSPETANKIRLLTHKHIKIVKENPSGEAVKLLADDLLELENILRDELQQQK